MSRRAVPLLLCLPLLLGGCVGLFADGPEPEEKTALEKAEFHYKLATGFVYEKKPIAALRELRLALEDDASHAESHYLTGFIYVGRKNYSEAVTHLRQAVRFKPKMHEALNLLAAAYMSLSRWQIAIDTLQPLLEDPLYASPWLAHNNAGWSYFKMGRRADALHHLQMAVFLNPKFCLGNYNLGLVHQASHQIEKARLQLEQARKKCPNHAKTLLALGEVYESLRRVADARTAYASCSELAEGSMLAERCRTRGNALR